MFHLDAAVMNHFHSALSQSNNKALSQLSQLIVWIYLCHSCLSEAKIPADALDSKKKVCVFSLHSHNDKEKRGKIPALTEACRCGISIPEPQLSYSVE